MNSRTPPPPPLFKSTLKTASKSGIIREVVGFRQINLRKEMFQKHGLTGGMTPRQRFQKHSLKGWVTPHQRFLETWSKRRDDSSPKVSEMWSKRWGDSSPKVSETWSKRWGDSSPRWLLIRGSTLWQRGCGRVARTLELGLRGRRFDSCTSSNTVLPH